MNEIASPIVTYPAPPRSLWVALAAAGCASFGLLLAAGGIVPILPLLALLAVLAVLSLPMHYTARALLFVALLADNPGERPMEDRWRSPLYAIGDILYVNLHKHSGVDLLRFSLLEVTFALLMLLVVWRKQKRHSIDDPHALGQLPSALKLAFACSFFAVLASEIYGLARGGDLRNSLWQLRQLLWLPVLGVLFGHAFKNAQARRSLLRMIVVVAVLRVIVGAYYYFAICRPEGYRPAYVLTHSDSALLVVAIMTAVAAMIERPSWGHLWLNLIAQPILLIGLIINDRRIAFVSLAGSMFSLVFFITDRARRAIVRLALVSLPAVLLYVAIGWHSNAGFFRPVGIIRSVSDQSDRSSATRDIENYNLIATLARHPIIGSGFGHEYHELVAADRVDQFFAQYRFIAHNSVLWLLAIAGFAGFTLFWIVFPVGIWIASRVHRESRDVLSRVTALVTIASIFSFIAQAWGDMGLQSWMGVLVTASLLGATGARSTSIQKGLLA